jgi:hypothetical protein
MRRLLTKIGLVSTALLAAGSSARAESTWEQSRDEDLEVRLVTFGPGAEVHQYFGHDAFEVRDRRRRLSGLYNFGMFSFGPDMLPKYLRGQLEFWGTVTPSEPTYRMYAEMGRSVSVRVLDLSPVRRRRLVDRLTFYMRPENRTYRYHHYDNNCTTRLRDLLDGALDGQFKALHSAPARVNLRAHTQRYTEHDPLVVVLLVFWMNDTMERPIKRYQEAFLPDELERLVDVTTYRESDGREVKLVSRRYSLAPSLLPAVPEWPSVLWPRMLAFGLAVGGIALVLGRWHVWRGSRLARALLGLWHVAVGALYGIPSLVATLFVFTEWRVTHWNENLLLGNAITFLALPFGLPIAFGAAWALRWMRRGWFALAASSLLLVVLKALPMFDQETVLIMCLALPVNLGFAAGLWRPRHRA